MSTGQEHLDSFYMKSRKGLSAMDSFNKFCKLMFKDYGNFALYNVCKGDEDMMASIMTDSLLSVYEFTEEVSKIDYFFPTTLRRKAIDFYRSKQYKNRVRESAIEESSHLTVRNEAIKRIEESDVNKIINSLSTFLTQRQLDVFLMYYEELNRTQIAEELDISIETVKSTISEARKRIKDYLKENDEFRKQLFP